MTENDPNEDEFPKLSVEEENQFKKLRLSIEHDANYFNNTNHNLPPEIEGMFLDSIYKFENAYRNIKKIKVYEKIGKPDFKNEGNLSDDEIAVELKRIEVIMRENKLNLSVICDYENQNRLIYKFITEEFST